MQSNEQQRRYILDGVEVDVETFIFANEFDHEVEPEAIRSMEVGEEIRFGGGAAPLAVLRRES